MREQNSPTIWLNPYKNPIFKPEGCSHPSAEWFILSSPSKKMIPKIKVCTKCGKILRWEPP